MSNSITIVITAPQETIATLNGRSKATKARETCDSLSNMLAAIAGGVISAQVQVITRGSDPGVTTDGATGSTSTTYNLL